MGVVNYHNGDKYYQEEGRLILWGEEHIFCIFTFRDLQYKLGQMYALSMSTKVAFDSPILVDFEREKNHKSFIPLIHNSTMYLITSFNPLNIIAMSTVSNNLASYYDV